MLPRAGRGTHYDSIESREFLLAPLAQIRSVVTTG